VSLNATQMTVTVPPAASAGTVEVVVTTPAGSSSTDGTANDFTYTAVAPTFSSMVVNGGDMYTIDAFGDKPTALVGKNSIVEQLLVTFSVGVTIASGAFRLDAGTTDDSQGPAPVTTPAAPGTDVVGIIAEPDPSSLDTNGGYKSYRLRFNDSTVGHLSALSYLDIYDNTFFGGNKSTGLKDGYYQLNIIGANVHAGNNVGGTAMASDAMEGLWRLFGSYESGSHSPTTNPNNDGSTFAAVTNSDLSDFANAYNTSRDDGTPPYNPNFDFNLDGSVINADLDRFAERYNAEWHM
jgi:hypothetical protein